MTNSSIRLLSPAKLNLFLLITGRRADGYHLLQTLFQILDYGDSMYFSPRQDGQIRLLTDFAGIPPQDNLIVRAAKLVQEQLSPTKRKLAGVDISIDKVLHMGGGLGGGSSNAATTLLALNHLWQANLSLTQLGQIGVQLGADVPVFVAGNTAYAEGVGEQLTPASLKESWYLVLNPQVSISTAEIFSNPQLTRDSTAIKIPALATGCIRNDCQEVVENLHPEVARARLWLAKFGTSQLTGTGACLFVRFPTEADALEVANQIPSGWKGFVARGINQSPVHTQLGQL